MPNKKVLFFQLTKKENGFEHLDPDIRDELQDLLNFILARDPIDRQWNIGENKFCRLEDVAAIGTDAMNILFKAAKHNYRAPLMHRHTGDERENPKTMLEGERIKTHMALKFDQDDEAIVCLETGQGIMQIQQIVNYLNHMNRLRNTTDVEVPINYSFDYQIIVKENFLQELQALNRVIESELIVDKQVLGGEALNYSNRIDTVKEDLKITIKAKRTFSIRDAVVDAYHALNGGRSTIKKIRVRGKNESNNDVLIDTEIIAKAEYVSTEIHEETGEVNTNGIFDQMNAIIYQL
jgi:hypothetical protein